MDSETAYAKINLALHVRRRRPDGYHEIETLFAFAQDGDRLSAEPAAELSLTISGPCADGLDAGPANLVLRAAEALRDVHGISAGASVHLEKRLPVAAGIGGGSADAAATIRLLARLWSIDAPVLLPPDIVLALGADVPACLASVTCFGDGVGNQLEAVDPDGVAGTPILLANPGVACPTGPVFAGWDGTDRGPLDAALWRGGRNDLEPPALALIPEIALLLEALAAQPGATLARMSGSGATCFALFSDEFARDEAARRISAPWVLASRLQ